MTTQFVREIEPYHRANQHGRKLTIERMAPAGLHLPWTSDTAVKTHSRRSASIDYSLPTWPTMGDETWLTVPRVKPIQVQGQLGPLK